MIYDGVLSALLGIEMSEMEKALRRQFGKKVKALELNTKAALHGYEWAQKNLKQSRFSLKRLDKTAGKIVIEGNQAAGLGLVFGGLGLVKVLLTDGAGCTGGDLVPRVIGLGFPEQCFVGSHL